MENDLSVDQYAPVELLMRMGLPALQQRHRELFGKDCPVLHVRYLRRKLAWELQARAAGGLPEESRQHALNIAWQSTLRTREHSVSSRPVHATLSFGQDTRIPPPGTLLRREFRGKPVVVKVLVAGFEHDGRIFGSLSSIAKEATGSSWNGFVFFGLAKDARRDR